VNDRFLSDEEIEAEGITPDELENPTDPIDLSPEHVICPRHGEPFRARWPKGYPLMAVSSFQALIDDPGFQELAGGDAGRINVLLGERPICERLSSPTLMALYIGSGVGRERGCELCGQIGLGTPYEMGRPGGTEKHRHVCFSCVVYRLQPAN
jgi:hypothetical protein